MDNKIEAFSLFELETPVEISVWGIHGAPIQKHLKLLKYIFNDPFGEAPTVPVPETTSESIIY